MSYGLEVRDSNGTTKVLTPSKRFGNVLAAQNVYITKNPSDNIPSSQTITLNMSGITTSNTSVLFGNVPGLTGNQGIESTLVTFGSTGITLSVANATNNSTFLNSRVIIVRF